MAANMKINVFWVVTPCNLLEVHRRFRDVCCVHRKDDRPDVGGKKHL
jgi:hypothetical protein